MPNNNLKVWSARLEFLLEVTMLLAFWAMSAGAAVFFLKVMGIL